MSAESEVNRNADAAVGSLLAASSIHHIGVAVRSLAEARALYEGTMGGVWEGVEELIERRVRLAFVRFGASADATRIELLEPMDETSTIAVYLEKRGPGLHHVAYVVTNLNERLAVLREAGVELIDQTPRRGAHGMRIAFLQPRGTGGVLTELCELANAGALGGQSR